MIVYSLFDGSGLMVEPWAAAGHTCYCFNADTADHGQYEMRVEHPNIHYVNCWIETTFNPVASHGLPAPDIVFSFPSCTKLAASGAKHDRDPADVAADIALAKVAGRLACKWGAPWMVENPVGALCTKWRKPDHYFNPFEYGGYLTGDEVQFHPKMPPKDAYTKRTGIWCGNEFVMPEKCPVEHTGCFWGWKYLGGSSPRTKQLRSLTPRGFARAVFLFNNKAIK